MKRTTTEILIEVEETVAVRLPKQKSTADKNEMREKIVEMIACPFCELVFPDARHRQQKNEK